MKVTRKKMHFQCSLLSPLMIHTACLVSQSEPAKRPNLVAKEERIKPELADDY